MNKTPSEAKALAEAIASKSADAKCDVVICPTAICIPAAVEAVKGSSVAVGAQNVHFKAVSYTHLTLPTKYTV